MKLKRRGLFARISATVVALLMVLFSTISVAYGLGDNDGVDETPVVATEPAESTEEPAQEAEEQSSEVTEPEKAEVVEEATPALAEKLRLATPHWTRHTHATHLLEGGAELTTVRDNLRHASLATTSM